MNAARLVHKLLCEGTVIVLNTDSNSVDGLKGALQQILGKSAAGAEKPQEAQEPEAAFPVTTRGGKRWIFRVNRDAAGSITSIEAQEP